MKKADCTPEQWDAYRAYQRDFARRNREKIAKRRRELLTPEKIEQQRARCREYGARPENKIKRKLLDSQPEAVARRRAYAQTQAAKINAKNRMEERLRTVPGLRDYRRNWHRLYKTGFSAELVEQVAMLQGHACAICHRPFSESNKHHADHDHDSNKPRGLLCFQCNIIEGKMRTIGLTALELGQRLHEYLLNPPCDKIK
jgi:hypothetical protein